MKYNSKELIKSNDELLAEETEFGQLYYSRNIGNNAKSSSD